MNIYFKKLSELAICPTSKNGDAGYDLYSTEDYSLVPIERHLFKTNIAVSIPTGYYGHICDRSGKALKEGIHVMGGIVDDSYRGDIGVILINLNRFYVTTQSDTPIPNTCIQIEKGDRIAQIIFKKYEKFDFVEVNELEQSIRGISGYGDSGR